MVPKAPVRRRVAGEAGTARTTATAKDTAIHNRCRHLVVNGLGVIASLFPARASRRSRTPAGTWAYCTVNIAVGEIVCLLSWSVTFTSNL